MRCRETQELIACTNVRLFIWFNKIQLNYSPASEVDYFWSLISQSPLPLSASAIRGICPTKYYYVNLCVCACVFKFRCLSACAGVRQLHAADGKRFRPGDCVRREFAARMCRQSTVERRWRSGLCQSGVRALPQGLVDAQCRTDGVGAVDCDREGRPSDRSGRWVLPLCCIRPPLLSCSRSATALMGQQASHSLVIVVV